MGFITFEFLFGQLVEVKYLEKKIQIYVKISLHNVFEFGDNLNLYCCTKLKTRAFSL